MNRQTHLTLVEGASPRKRPSPHPESGLFLRCCKTIQSIPRRSSGQEYFHRAQEQPRRTRYRNLPEHGRVDVECRGRQFGPAQTEVAPATVRSPPASRRIEEVRASLEHFTVSKGRKLTREPFELQARQVMDDLSQVLAACGSSVAHLLQFVCM